MQKDSAFLQPHEKLVKQAEAARFCVYTVNLCGKKLSTTYTEIQRAADIRREMATLRGKIGNGVDTEWIPKVLYAKLVAWVTKAK